MAGPDYCVASTVQLAYPAAAKCTSSSYSNAGVAPTSSSLRTHPPSRSSSGASYVPHEHVSNGHRSSPSSASVSSHGSATSNIPSPRSSSSAPSAASDHSHPVRGPYPRPSEASPRAGSRDSRASTSSAGSGKSRRSCMSSGGLDFGYNNLYGASAYRGTLAAGNGDGKATGVSGRHGQYVASDPRSYAGRPMMGAPGQMSCSVL